MHGRQGYLCVGGIRSTGISAAMGIAEYAVQLLENSGFKLEMKQVYKPVRMPAIGQADIRPHQDEKLVAANPTYAEMVCHCERVSRGELNDALNGVIPATTLDGIRRRTRASQGRCQGFNCHAALVRTLSNKEETGNFSVETERIVKEPSRLNLSRDVLIIGAGPAGLSAAIELKRRGIKNILVVDREPEAGGMPRMCHHTGFGRSDLWRMYTGPRYARHYRELARKMDVENRISTSITGWESPSKVDFTSPSGLGNIEAGAILLATGVRERPRAARMVPGARPQGIYTTGSLQRFVYQEKLPVGKRAVIVGAELVSLSALMTLMDAKVSCIMMTTEESNHQIEFPYVVMKWALADLLLKTPILTNTQIVNIFGKKHLEGIEISSGNGQNRFVECDTLIFTGNWIPENELARLGGLEINSRTGGPRIDANYQSSVGGVFVAGNLLRGVETADHCALEGKRAGSFIAKYLSGKS
jgi:thioredoxin reductase